MLRHIFANDNSGFGAIVTAESVDSHLQARRTYREPYRLENGPTLNAFKAAAAR